MATQRKKPTKTTARRKPARQKPARKKPAARKQAPRKKAARKGSAQKRPVMRTLTPTCSVPDAAGAVALYERVFGAEVLDAFTGEDGKLAHAELAIGDSVFMIGEPWAGPRTMQLAVQVDDADAVWREALKAGCTVVFPLEDQFYGERAGRVQDPWGNQWAISAHVEDVSTAEQKRRFEKIARGESWR